ncbi:MAG TPA: hypothetical protein VMW49_08580 [Candidatus Dormibacteraeota bacterium]|nr:hypothetical protein [Candidatus Dormibacteraeota bacterium]
MDGPAPAIPRSRPRSGRRRSVAVWALSALLLTTATALLAVRAAYQPLQFAGSVGGGSWGTRSHGRIHLPFRQGSFTIGTSLVNGGALPVRLTGATFAPTSRSEVYPLVAAGPAVVRQSTWRPGEARWGQRRLAGTVLQPGDAVLILLRLRFHGCRTAATHGGGAIQSTYVVHFSLLGAARTATLPMGAAFVIPQTAPCR